MKEDARQGFWNGALPPIGHRINTKVLEDPGAEAGDRSRRHGGAADCRPNRVRGGANAAQEPKSGDGRTKDRQRADPPYQNLLLRRLWWRDDAAHGQEWPLP